MLSEIILMGFLATDISKKKLGDRIIEITKVKTNHLKQM